MELLYGGKVVNAASVDWTMTSIRNFSVRQRPGPGNALGQIKFLFPNQHDVYLHDTPSKSLFSRSFRAYSHGCIRVQNPMEFAEALVVKEPGITRASLEDQFGPKERWNNLPNHIPVHITYFTLRVDEDGTIRSFGDVYGHNKRMIEFSRVGGADVAAIRGMRARLSTSIYRGLGFRPWLGLLFCLKVGNWVGKLALTVSKAPNASFFCSRRI
jgi:murein L,D-transpeptidase YcbB/YkuD